VGILALSLGLLVVGACSSTPKLPNTS